MNTTNELIEQALGIPVQKSPVYTAKTLLRECYRDKPHIIRDASFDLRDLPFKGSAIDLIWRMSDLAEYMIGRWVHVYDKSGAYLAACSNTNTGVGNPIHTPMLYGHPGIYRIEIEQRPEQEKIPVIEYGQEWVTWDVLQYAEKQGYKMVIIDGWLFPDYEKVLGNRDSKRNWAKRLWDARQALKGTPAYEDMKVIATVGMGGFATSKDKYGGLNLIHPNWFFDHVGKARVNMFHNIKKYAGNAVLIRVKTDELMYVSRDPNPRTAIPGIFDRVGQLGGYKHVCSVQITRQMYEQSAGLTASGLGKLIKDAAGLQEKEGEE